MMSQFAEDLLRNEKSKKKAKQKEYLFFSTKWQIVRLFI
jgi:hypothetical protein